MASAVSHHVGNRAGGQWRGGAEPVLEREHDAKMRRRPATAVRAIAARDRAGFGVVSAAGLA